MLALPIALICVAMPVATPGARATGYGEPPSPAVGERRLSDERKLSRWAYVLQRTRARIRPRPHARTVKRLRTVTADRTRELVLALTQRRTRDHGTWVEARMPMRPNGTTAWVKRAHLGSYRTVTTQLRINRDRFAARLLRDGERVWRAPVGVGEEQWPTPAGRFYVRERLIPEEKDGIYGIFAFGTSAYSPTLSDWPGGGVIGIHGTNQPYLIPGRISHGCVRVRNRKIRRLRRLMPLGTPILIR